MKLKTTAVGTLVLLTAFSSIAAAQQIFSRREPINDGWYLHYRPVGVPPIYGSAEAACDAVFAAHGCIEGDHVPNAACWNRQVVLTSDHIAQCMAKSNSNPDGATFGSPFHGAVCPERYSMRNYTDSRWDADIGNAYYGLVQYCQSDWPVVDRWHDKPKQCQPQGGNPIYPLTGTKRQSEDLFRWSPVVPSLTVTFDNRRKLPNADPEGAFSGFQAPSFGGLWESNLHKRLFIELGTSPIVYYRHIQASRGSGAWISFIRRTATGETQTPDSDIADRIVNTSSGVRYVDAKAMAQEDYSSVGVLASVAYASGAKLTYTYSDATTSAAIAPVAGLLIKLQDQFGRALNFEYEQPSGVSVPRVARIIDPDGQPTQAAYDTAGNLSQIVWPDGKLRRFLYEQSALPWALTGIVDENNERHSTYTYDAEGRAQSTEYAGGVNRYSLSYSNPPRWVTTETFDTTFAVFWRDHNWQVPQDAVMTTPNGSTESFGATLINGMPRVTTRSQPAGAGCDASSSSLTYDANGNVDSKTDFNGTKSCHAYDLSRDLETARIDGLGAADACPANIGAFAIAIGASQRKTTTQWHPAWSSPIKQAEPKKITISVYNGQPDPTAGDATASCAPTTALLPDDSRIVALCKKVEQATTDATGSLGFNATVTGTPRIWTYTYNQYGQMLTARDPLSKLTTYVYYSDTTDQHTMGDLQSVTDSVGRVTQYTRYNKSGRLMQSIDANGAVTDTTFTPRGWVKTVTVTPTGAAAQLSVYDYDGVGQLKKATLPDGAALEYTYDAAHRLTSVKDAAGNSVTFTLDNMGNRESEDLKDPSGTLARNITRVYDALNRVQSSTERVQ